MNNEWTERWNDRYRKQGFAYGKEPNSYFKEKLANHLPGSILLAAEGEGRNVVYAAMQGWNASAFDISEEGRIKAMELSRVKNVTVDYQVGELDSLGYRQNQFDAIALIYAHFPTAIKSLYHQQLKTYLRPGGALIFEAFSKKHLEYLAVNEKVGGPKEPGMLFSIEEVRNVFSDFEIIELVESEIELSEGEFHNGTGCVIRFHGVKKSR